MQDIRGIEYVPSIAHLSLETGEVFQVLSADSTDWDEAATVAARDAWLREQPAQ